MFRQVVAVSWMSLGGISSRLGASIVVVIGITAVVGVLVSVFTMARSLTDTFVSVGRPDRAIVLRSGTNAAEGASILSLDSPAAIANAPGIARTVEGRSAVTADIVTSVNRPRRANGKLRALSVRGVGTDNFAVRPEIVLVDGRHFMPGLREAIIGRSAQTEFEGLELGSEVKLRDGVWTIVGVFTTGNATESGLITDVDTLASALGAGFVNSVTVRLESEGAFDTFKAALAADPTLSVEVYREPEFFEQNGKNLANLFFFITYVVCSIMAAGALVGALNTMYAAVSSRAVEIATLRALGFGASGVVASILLESLALAALGAAAGSVVSWLLFSGDSISLGRPDSTLVATLDVTAATLATGFAWALTVGLLGALLPAIRAARLPVATALRAV